MRKLFIILAAASALAGCVTGKPEFAPMPGEHYSQAELNRAKAYCAMKLQETDLAPMQLSLEQLNAYAYNCFASQGIRLKGYRQKNGKLTVMPIQGSKEAP